MNLLTILMVSSAALVGVVSAAHAADLIVEEPNAPGVISIPSGNWDGPFVGVFGGYLNGPATSPINFNLSGALVGVDVGANFTLGNGIVAGVVGDVAWSNATDDVIIRPGAFDEKLLGSVRGRVGYDAGSFMPYLTAGVAFANATLTASNGAVIDNKTHFGWTVGGGVEVKLTQNLSADVSYRYSDYGPQAYGVVDWKFASHQVTAGLNWHF